MTGSRPLAAVLLLALLSAASAATVEINNRTGLELYFVWVSESRTEKWVDMLGLEILDAGETLEFQVDRGYYDIRIEDSNWDSYTVLEIPLGDDDVFVWNVSPSDRDD
jgi:hypothetical protein